MLLRGAELVAESLSFSERSSSGFEIIAHDFKLAANIKKRRDGASNTNHQND